MTTPTNSPDERAVSLAKPAPRHEQPEPGFLAWLLRHSDQHDLVRQVPAGKDPVAQLAAAVRTCVARGHLAGTEPWRAADVAAHIGAAHPKALHGGRLADWVREGLRLAEQRHPASQARPDGQRLNGEHSGDPGAPTAAAFRRWVIHAAAGGYWPTWCEFTDVAWRHLTDRPDVHNSAQAWAAAGDQAGRELATLGLHADVWTTQGVTLPPEQHNSAHAGLVRIHNGTDTDEPTLSTPDCLSAYQLTMATKHHYVPHLGLPRTPRGICGQWEWDHPTRHLGWLDHVSTWLQAGEPVLTAEPYHVDPDQAREDIATLPLELTAHDGMWNEATTLLILTPDPDAEPLPAEPDKEAP